MNKATSVHIITYSEEVHDTIVKQGVDSIRKILFSDDKN